MNRQTIGRAVLPIAVLAIGIAITASLVASKPEPTRTDTVDRGVLAQTQLTERSLERFDISAQGLVIPSQEVTIQPQVSGRVLAMSPDLEPGGLIREGEVLLRIDPSDYELAVASARTGLAEAKASLALEQGRRVVAEREWALFGDEIGDAAIDPALALREPQLQRAEAVLASAQAALDRALLDLERTAIRAPFNALVRAEAADVGQIVGPQSVIATLVGTDAFWIRASVQPYALALIEEADARADIVFDVGGQPVNRTGRVVRTLGDLDPAGQMARVLIEVTDPLGIGDQNPARPLLLGSYVDLVIAGRQEREVVRVPRTWLRDGESVFVLSDGHLEIRPVTIVWRQADTVLVGDGLRGGEQVVTSSIATPVAGMRLRTAGQPLPALGSETP